MEETKKTRMKIFLQSLERSPRRLVVPAKSHKTIAKYRLGDLIKLADRVARDPGKNERTLRKASKNKSARTSEGCVHAEALNRQLANNRFSR